MQEMENIITRIGWLDKCADGTLDPIDKNPIVPNIHKDSST
jgi:hypothetical protein